MRIPYPERVPINRVAIFAAALFVIQQLEGTALYFSCGCTIFILLSAFAFNTAGGLTRASGAYVFFYSLLVVIVGLCYKAVLGEPAQSNLLDPRTTIEVYDGGMAGMLAAVILSQRISRKTGLLQDVLKESKMYRASVGCMLFGIIGPFLIIMLGTAGAKLQSAFTQLNQLIPLGIIIGVMYEIRRSGGKRSLNLPIVAGGAYCFIFYGLGSFSKQGMLLPLVCWLLPVCAMRFRLSTYQIIGCLLTAFLVFYYLVPYSQWGRRFATDNQSLTERMTIAVGLVENIDEVRKDFTLAAESDLGGYYNTAQGFWDRLQFISVDDGLINITDQGKVFGLLPIKVGFLNAIPHFLWPNKPASLNFGNEYMHEITGIAADEGLGVGISFSPTAEAYHMAKWFGVLVVAPLVWTMFFVTYDTIFGDVRSSPWGLLSLALLSHSAPEGALTGPIYLVTFGLEALVFCAYFSAWVAPSISTFVLGPDRQQVTPRFEMKPAPTAQ